MTSPTRTVAHRIAAGLVVVTLGVGVGVALLSRTGTAAPVAAMTSVVPAAAAVPDTVGPTDDAAAAVAAVAAARQVRAGKLTAALAALAVGSSVDFGLAVINHRTGEVFTYNGDQAFETASVVKVEILAALLLQTQRAGASLTASQQQLADVMIRQSDNDAASALWDQIGDANGLAAASSAFGLTSTDPGSGGYWGLTTTTPSDQVRLLDAVTAADGPLGTVNSTLVDLMGDVDADQDWGVSAAAQSGEATILKNGWLQRSTDNDRWTINSIGRITGTGTDLTIAVMSHGNATLSGGISLVEQLAQLTRTDLAW